MGAGTWITSEFGLPDWKETEAGQPEAGRSPSALPRSLGVNARAAARHYRQVFGLTGELLAPTNRSFPAFKGQCFHAAFVPVYRCGAVPDSHRVPFSSPSKNLNGEPATGPQYMGTIRKLQIIEQKKLGRFQEVRLRRGHNETPVLNTFRAD